MSMLMIVNGGRAVSVTAYIRFVSFHYSEPHKPSLLFYFSLLFSLQFSLSLSLSLPSLSLSLSLPLLLLISLQSALFLCICYDLLLHRKSLPLPHVINVTPSNVTLDVPLCVFEWCDRHIYVCGVIKCVVKCEWYEIHMVW
jgi:hypothetical protein